MQVDEILDYRQAQTGAAEFACRPPLCLTEAIKDRRTHLGGDPASAVLDAEQQTIIPAEIEGASDPASGRRELEGVGEQIEQNAVEFLGVDFCFQRFGCRNHVGKRPLRRQCVEVRGDGAHGMRQVDARVIDCHLARI
ncbi:hypothetical protein D3C78_834380 [compost metagenome]